MNDDIWMHLTPNASNYLYNCQLNAWILLHLSQTRRTLSLSIISQHLYGNVSIVLMLSSAFRSTNCYLEAKKNVATWKSRWRALDRFVSERNANRYGTTAPTPTIAKTLLTTTTTTTHITQIILMSEKNFKKTATDRWVFLCVFICSLHLYILLP